MLLALHRGRSFLAAGKALGVSTSTASRRIDALESALGRPLVTRTSAGTILEPDAMVLVQLAEELESGLRGARRVAGDDALTGVVRVSMPDAFARPVTAMLAELRRSHSALTFDVHCDARMVDLARREADVAIRTARSSSEVVVDRHAGRFRMFLYAAPSYVERRLREPRLRLADAARQDFVGYDRDWETVPQHQWLVSIGAERFAFRSNTDDAIAEAIVGGFGLGPLTPAQARSLDVVRIEVESEGPSMPVFVSYHRDLRREPRVRVVVESLTAQIRQALA